MFTAPRVGEEFIETKPPVSGDHRGLGSVDFSICPHSGHPELPENTMEAAERWAARIGGPPYAIDDETAICVRDDDVRVVYVGRWQHVGTRGEPLQRAFVILPTLSTIVRAT